MSSINVIDSNHSWGLWTINIINITHWIYVIMPFENRKYVYFQCIVHTYHIQEYEVSQICSNCILQFSAVYKRSIQKTKDNGPNKLI